MSPAAFNGSGPKGPSRDQTVCCRFDRRLSAYVDDELDAIHNLEVEEHLEICAPCREAVATLRATRSSMQRMCKTTTPSALRARIQRSVEAERLYDEAHSLEGAVGSVEERVSEPPFLGAPSSLRPASQVEPSGSVRPSSNQPLGRLRFVVPLAVAATFALVFGAMRLRDLEADKSAVYQPASAEVQSASLDNLLEELVSQHMHPPPPETTDPDGLRRFDQFVGVRVRQPNFDEADVRWVGARMTQRAALLQYLVRDRQRLTMCVFDPRKVMMRTGRLVPRNLNARVVYVGHLRGYAVAASEREGIGYALASDLDDEESARLMAMASR